MTKSKFIILSWVLLFVANITTGRALAGEQPLTVVELFTSQGCSSCPPADAFLGDLAKREDILALSVHVDYWDYIGWKDRFADAAHTLRQKDYAEQFSLRYVYTPQMVIHGAYQSVGSKRSEVLSYINKARKLPSIKLSLTRSSEGVELTLPQTQIDEDVEIFSVFYNRNEKTDIKRGENGGQNLTYHNVVRKIKSIATWRGEAKRMPIRMAETSAEVCAIILQLKGSRRIIGATRISLNAS